jgi:hypothetical protein
LAVPIYGGYLMTKAPEHILKHPIPYVRYKAMRRSKSWQRVDVAISTTMFVVCLGFALIILFGYLKVQKATSFYLQGGIASLLLAVFYGLNAILTLRQLQAGTVDLTDARMTSPFATLTSGKSPSPHALSNNGHNGVAEKDVLHHAYRAEVIETTTHNEPSLLDRLRQEQQMRWRDNHNNSRGSNLDHVEEPQRRLSWYGENDKDDSVTYRRSNLNGAGKETPSNTPKASMETSYRAFERVDGSFEEMRRMGALEEARVSNAMRNPSEELRRVSPYAQGPHIVSSTGRTSRNSAHHPPQNERMEDFNAKFSSSISVTQQRQNLPQNYRAPTQPYMRTRKPIQLPSLRQQLSVESIESVPSTSTQQHKHSMEEENIAERHKKQSEDRYNAQQHSSTSPISMRHSETMSDDSHAKNHDTSAESPPTRPAVGGDRSQHFIREYPSSAFSESTQSVFRAVPAWGKANRRDNVNNMEPPSAGVIQRIPATEDSNRLDNIVPPPQILYNRGVHRGSPPPAFQKVSSSEDEANHSFAAASSQGSTVPLDDDFSYSPSYIRQQRAISSIVNVNEQSRPLAFARPLRREVEERHYANTDTTTERGFQVVIRPHHKLFGESMDERSLDRTTEL